MLEKLVYKLCNRSINKVYSPSQHGLFSFVFVTHTLLNLTGCLNLMWAWNTNPSSRLNSESSWPCKWCDDRGPCAISMPATASAIRQNRQLEHRGQGQGGRESISILLQRTVGWCQKEREREIKCEGKQVNLCWWI